MATLHVIMLAWHRSFQGNENASIAKSADYNDIVISGNNCGFFAIEIAARRSRMKVAL